MDDRHCELSATVREQVGKSSSRLLRRENKIPAVIYGEEIPTPKSIALSTKEVTKRLHSGGFMTTVLTLDLGKEKIRALPKDYQLDPVSDTVIHVDFLHISDDSKISVQIPVSFLNENKSPGIKQGGILNVVRHEIALYCPANQIPESIPVDLAGLKIGDSIHIANVSLPKDASPVSQHDITIATIVAPASEINTSE
ncbi:50S ribosomal protein L25/general stress protein Ctc [Candidatus Liberibacter sp.]|uniref:50S ribosomal protein L25/general stress protein Ctc n=1 Tax=Candidatus Liberibacter sp. TaxID=34022 RepID=UPI0015F57C92|nr:50S ribosomal protein L25/general stress protein Ctc [Candidatus Liberibacter sp.]MBA5723603.1 50S ribosomal protein L25/general stress protein Ctc [Candidatus Liberibacter sp.]